MIDDITDLYKGLKIMIADMEVANSLTVAKQIFESVTKLTADVEHDVELSRAITDRVAGLLRSIQHAKVVAQKHLESREGLGSDILVRLSELTDKHARRCSDLEQRLLRRVDDVIAQYSNFGTAVHLARFVLLAEETQLGSETAKARKAEEERRANDMLQAFSDDASRAEAARAEKARQAAQRKEKKRMDREAAAAERRREEEARRQELAAVAQQEEELRREEEERRLREIDRSVQEQLLQQEREAAAAELAAAELAAEEKAAAEAAGHFDAAKAESAVRPAKKKQPAHQRAGKNSAGAQGKRVAAAGSAPAQPGSLNDEQSSQRHGRRDQRQPQPSQPQPNPSQAQAQHQPQHQPQQPQHRPQPQPQNARSPMQAADSHSRVNTEKLLESSTAAVDISSEDYKAILLAEAELEAEARRREQEDQLLAQKLAAEEGMHTHCVDGTSTAAATAASSQPSPPASAAPSGQATAEPSAPTAAGPPPQAAASSPAAEAFPPGKK